MAIAQEFEVGGLFLWYLTLQAPYHPCTGTCSMACQILFSLTTSTKKLKTSVRVGISSDCIVNTEILKDCVWRDDSCRLSPQLYPLALSLQWLQSITFIIRSSPQVCLIPVLELFYSPGLHSITWQETCVAQPAWVLVGRWNSNSFFFVFNLLFGCFFRFLSDFVLWELVIL